MVDRVFELVKNLVDKKGLSVLLVEQNVRNALQMCQRGYVIEHGQLLKTGSGQELLHDPDVQRSYMGL
jgi:branched-chain amino acid transport system ATP-binding protein